MTNEQPKCLICGSPTTLVSTQVAGAPEASIYRCQACDMVFQHPIMSTEAESKFYETDWPSYMEGRAGSSWKAPADHFAVYARTEGLRRLGLVGDKLARDWDVLEIGSSTGYFLELMRPLVRSVAGVDPNPEQSSFARARGLETLTTVEELGDRKFDALFIYYVLEHMREPVPFLMALGKYLRPGGKLFIEVPNVLDSLVSTYDIPCFGPFYWQKAHYFYYSPKTLTDVLSRAGFRGDMLPVQRYDLSNHMWWMMKGRPGGMGKYKDVFPPDLEVAYAACLKNRWICDTVFAIAEAFSR